MKRQRTLNAILLPDHRARLALWGWYQTPFPPRYSFTLCLLCFTCVGERCLSFLTEEKDFAPASKSVSCSVVVAVSSIQFLTLSLTLSLTLLWKTLIINDSTNLDSRKMKKNPKLVVAHQEFINIKNYLISHKFMLFSQSRWTLDINLYLLKQVVIIKLIERWRERHFLLPRGANIVVRSSVILKRLH